MTPISQMAFDRPLRGRPVERFRETWWNL